MKRFEVIVSPEAQRSIYADFSYIRERSPKNAETWLVGLYEAINSLEEMPGRYGDAREAVHLGLPLKQLIYKSHRIIYLFDESTVRIVTVRHAKRQSMRKGELPDNL